MIPYFLYRNTIILVYFPFFNEWWREGWHVSFMCVTPSVNYGLFFLFLLKRHAQTGKG